MRNWFYQNIYCNHNLEIVTLGDYGEWEENICIKCEHSPAYNSRLFSGVREEIQNLLERMEYESRTRLYRL